MDKTTSELGLYFIAVIPPDPICRDAQQWKEHFSKVYQSKASLNSPPHITLHMPFKCKSRKEQLLIKMLTAVGKKNKSFELKVDGFDGFDPRVIFIKVPKSLSLDTLHKRVAQVMKTSFNIFNADYRDRPFHPHLTLAFRDLKKDKFAVAWDEFKSKQYQKEFLVDQFWLLKHDGKRWQPFQVFYLSD